MRIYVAGKYGDHLLPASTRLGNVMAAINAGRELIKKGHNPYIPHLSHWVHEGWGWEGSNNQLWYRLDLEWLEHCDGILMLADWEHSTGAKLEMAHAITKMISVYFSLEEIPDG